MTDDAQRTLLLRRRREKADQNAGSATERNNDDNADPALDDLVAQLATLKQQLHERETTITKLRQPNAGDTEQYGSVHAGLPVFRLSELFASAVDVKMLGQGKQATVYRLRFPTDETCILRVYNFKFAEHLPGEHVERYDQIMAFFRTEQSMPQELQDHQVVLPLQSSFFVEAEGGVFQPANAYQDIPGQTIAALQAASPLSELDVLDIIEQTAYSLSKAHAAGEKGILHRDIKEENLLRRERDRGITLLDCGIAREADVASLTGTVGVGTRGYMAQEQEIGNPVPASDVYSLGIMAKKLLHGVVRDRTLQKLLDDMAAYDVGDRVQRFGLSDVKTNKIASAVVERIQQYRGILNGHAVETLAGLSGEAMTGWDVPDLEASVYARQVIKNDSLNVLKKIARLEQYLATEPVREREIGIVQEAIQLLKGDVAVTEIDKILDQRNQERPELVFGFSRDELYDISQRAGSLTGSSLPLRHPFFLELARQPEYALFRDLIETASQAGMRSVEIGSMFMHLETARLHSIALDQNAYRERLRHIKDGTLDAKVEEWKEKYKQVVGEKELNDPRYLAMLSVLEEQTGLPVVQRYSRFSTSEDGIEMEGRFGKFLYVDTKLTIHRAAMLAATVAGGVLGYHVGDMIPDNTFDWIPTTYAIEGTMFGILAGTVAGIISLLIDEEGGGHNVPDFLLGLATRNKYYGGAQVYYSPDNVVHAVKEYIHRCKGVEPTAISDAVTKAGEMFKGKLSPYDLLDAAHDSIMASDARLEGQPKNNPGDPHA